MPTLSDPVTIGSLTLPNRIFMAPLTRARAARDHVPTPVMAEYYAQRSEAGLIITEATGISQQGLGWPFAPGIWSSEQRDAWKAVTDAVHATGGHIFVQLWHMGRIVHPDFIGGNSPISASATTAPGDAYTYSGKQPYAQSRALTLAEIPGLVDDYRAAARNAVATGFDGVQLHAANGYLIDQFLRDSSNQRDDEYGGSVENRARLLVQVTKALVEEAGAGRVAVRLSPNGDTQGVIDSNPEPLFAHVAQRLEELGVAFLELREPGPEATFGQSDQPRLSPMIRQHFTGPLVLNSDYSFDSAQQALADGNCDAISFGRPFIGNPDLVTRFQRGAALADAPMETWYSQGPHGYVDYPALNAE